MLFKTPHCLSSEFLDAMESRLAVGTAMACGAVCGLAWGVLGRVWMRFISAHPAVSAGGTAYVVAVPTLFGVCAGLAFAARRRGWRRARLYVPRVLTVVLFIPFGVAGGGPLMLTVLLATLAIGWPDASWVIAGLRRLPRWSFALALVGIALAISYYQGISPGLILFASCASAWTAWTVAWPRVGAEARILIQRWLARIVRAAFLSLAAFLLVLVCQEIIHDNPDVRSVPYIAMYLVLLCPLVFALNIALRRASVKTTACKTELVPLV